MQSFNKVFIINFHTSLAR